MPSCIVGFAKIFEGPSNLHGLMALHDERWLTGAVPVCSNHQYGDAQGETPQTGSAPVLLNTRDYLPPWLDVMMLTSMIKV